MAMTETEWAAKAFALLHKEWIRTMPNSTRDRELRQFLLAAPIPIKEKFLDVYGNSGRVK